eukprot:1262996-Rhodomonas_salina.1
MALLCGVWKASDSDACQCSCPPRRADPAPAPSCAPAPTAPLPITCSKPTLPCIAPLALMLSVCHS